ncbi:hypothetical protein CIRG_09838 [Coccidioides immitis RMSCC 2394]|uniref:Uncharacterized protein n=1 Tax=Coccidioides immitis RMSCC 2394 TaxID=404692 RepID=A0A0J6YQZ2_COCIT|nr:hypothetical protein CIRG_09838 [Coccidioides immitis RMSCC 2394]
MVVEISTTPAGYIKALWAGKEIAVGHVDRAPATTQRRRGRLTDEGLRADGQPVGTGGAVIGKRSKVSEDLGGSQVGCRDFFRHSARLCNQPNIHSLTKAPAAT